MPNSRPRRKRSRKSSSDAEQKTTPLPKRDKPSDKHKDNVDVMASSAESGMATEALNAKLNSILEGQETLRAEITANFVQQSQQLAALIDQKLAGLRAEIDNKLGAVYNELRDVKRRVDDIEVRGANDAMGGAVISPDDPEVVSLRRRLDVLEDTSTDRSLSLIVKGINETETDTTAQLLATCQELISQLQVTTTITAAQRLGTDTRGRKPRLVSMRLPNIEAVKMVMQNKRKLKVIQGYSSVYIEPDVPRDTRTMQANIRRLARDNPSVEMRRGRLVDKGGTQNGVAPPPVAPGPNGTQPE